MPMRLRRLLVLSACLAIITGIGLFEYFGLLSALAAPVERAIVSDARLSQLAEDYLVVVNHRCGGVLLDELHAATSAHCVSLSRTKFGEQQLDPSETETIFVTNRQVEVGVKEVVIHADYRSDAPEGSIDIAILTLDRPLSGTKAVASVGRAFSNEQVVYLARNSGPRGVILESCPLGLGRPYYSYGRTNFQCINHIDRDQIGTCAGDSGSPIISVDFEGNVKLVAIQHAGHSLDEKIETPCLNGHESLAYGVTLVMGPIEGWVESGMTERRSD